MLTNPSMIVPTQKAVNCLIDRNNNNNNNNHNHGSGMRDTITNGSTTSSKLIKHQTTTTPTTLMTTTIGTISSDPGILCFHHCNIKVFCFVLPHICPNCQTELDGHTMLAASSVNNNNNNNKVIRISTTSTKLLPFRLPYPFVRASQTPCAIVLRPTIGDFLNDYNNTMDLHIAVTTSTGCVVEFDRCGLRRHRADNMSEWWQCLLVGDVPEPWYDYWDQVLTQICKQPSRWSVAHYNEDSHNCYAFVLAFLQALGYEKLSAAASSKTRFCEKFIVPRTTTAGKYISLYRKLKTAGIYMHPHPAQQQQQQQQKPLQHHHNNQSKTNVVGSTKNMLPVSTTNTTTTTTAAIKLPLHNRKHNNSNNNQQQQQYNKMTTKTLTNKTKTITSSIIKRRSTLCTIQE